MANWARNIARSATDDTQKDSLEDLFVFGYECKVFSDDEKARYLEEGRHLIPWMGDSSLMIDRYDGRGHLYDISPYDADLNKGSYDELSEAEAAVERACENERYLELHTDLMEQATYEEEEMKRLNEGNTDSYAAISFNYDIPSTDDQETEENKLEEEDAPAEVEEPYVAPPELKVPEGMHVPPSMKMHAIMEKTAQFIARQGAQMEIVIKTKQANNPQFDFLSFTHYLNPFYKHLVKMIKSGIYRPIPQDVRKRMEEEQNIENPVHYEEEIDSHNFLKSVQDKLPAGQIANTAYEKLVSRMASASGRNSPEPSTILARYPGNNAIRGPPVTTSTYNTEQTSGYRPPLQGPATHPSYASSSNPTTSLATAKNHYASHTASNYWTEDNYRQEAHGDEQEQDYDGYGDHYNHAQYSSDSGYYNDQYGADSYDHRSESTQSSQRYGNDGYLRNEGNSSGSSSDSRGGYGYQASEGNAYPQSYPTATTTGKMPPPPGMEPVTLPSTTQPPPPGTVSPDPEQTDVVTDQGDEASGKIIVPPPDMLPIIDKMAAYVAKNGPDFELVVQSKEDERFNFLYSWHPHYAYYSDKKRQFAIEEGQDVGQTDERNDQNDVYRPRNGVDNMLDNSPQNRGAKAAVSFSIKTKPKENDRSQPSLKPPRTLLNDSSEDEEGNTETEDVTMDESDSSELVTSYTPAATAVVVKQAPEVPKQEKPVVPADELEKKIAEEQLKNKLATAAREKLAQNSKEKQIQAERKRRAAMFISMLKGSSQGSSSTGSDTSTTVSEPVQGPAPAPASARPVSLQVNEDIKPSGASDTTPESVTTSVATASSLATAAPRPLPFIAMSTSHLLSDRSKSPERRQKDKTQSHSRSERRRRSPVPKRSRSRSASRPRKHRRSRSKSKSRSSKSRKRSRSRSKSKSKSHKPKDKRRSRSRSGSRSKSKKSKDKRRSRSRSRSKSKKSKDKKKGRSRSRSRSKSKLKESKSSSRSSEEKRSQSVSISPMIEIKEDIIGEELSAKGDLLPIRAEIIDDDDDDLRLNLDDEFINLSPESGLQPRPELLERVREMLKASRTANQN